MNWLVPLDQDEPRTPPDIRRRRAGEGHPPADPGELLALDRYCAENKLTRSQVIRRALKGHLIQRAIGREDVSRPVCYFDALTHV